MAQPGYFEQFNSMDLGTKIFCGYLKEKDPQIVISINGDMETHHARFFTNAMNALFSGEHGLKAVLLDLEKVKYISSSCISSLLQLVHQAGDLGLSLFFVNPRPHMQEVIDAMGFGHFIKQIKLPANLSLSITCGKCKAKVNVKMLGKFKCPECGAALSVSDKGLMH
jgi:anti-anti-sigma factor